jgi:hypothetical protein
VSNELRSVHDVSPDQLEPVQMPDCVDCHKPWTMTAMEHSRWNELVKTKHLHWPRRCRNCREVKRSQRSKSPTISDVISRLKEMTELAINEKYMDDPDSLAQALSDVVSQLSTIDEKSRR